MISAFDICSQIKLTHSAETKKLFRGMQKRYNWGRRRGEIEGESVLTSSGSQDVVRITTAIKLSVIVSDNHDLVLGREMQVGDFLV